MSVQPPKTYYKPKNKRQEKIILPIILCKNNYSLPQVGNDQTIFYKNVLARRTGKGCSTGMPFVNILVSMYKLKSLTKINQPENTQMKQLVPVRLHQALTGYL